MAGYLLITIAICASLMYVSKAEFPFGCPNGVSPNVTIYGRNQMTCPEGSVCNKYGIKVNANDTIVQACLAASAACKFECSKKAANIAIVNGEELMCPLGYKCNTEDSTCEICVVQPCDPDEFKCTNATVAVMADGTEIHCPSDKVCNADHIYPCTPCINKSFKCELVSTNNKR